MSSDEPGTSRARRRPTRRPHRSWRAPARGALAFAADGTRAQFDPVPCKAPVDYASLQPAAPNDQALGHTMDDHLTGLHVEIEQRLAAIVVAHEHRRQLASRIEAKMRAHAIIECSQWLQRRSAAIPVVAIGGLCIDRAVKIAGGAALHRRADEARRGGRIAEAQSEYQL